MKNSADEAATVLSHPNINILLGLIVLLTPGLALAYVGPGAGITMLSSLWGLIIAAVFVIVGLFVLPIKLMRNKLRKRREEAQAYEAERSPVEQHSDTHSNAQSGDKSSEQ